MKSALSLLVPALSLLLCCAQTFANQRSTLLGPPNYLADTSVEIDVDVNRSPTRWVAIHSSYVPGSRRSSDTSIRPVPVVRAQANAEAGVLPGRLSTLASVSGGISTDAQNRRPFMRAQATSSVTRFWRFESNDPSVTQAELDFRYVLSGEHFLEGIGVPNAPGSSVTRFRLDVLDENHQLRQTPIRIELRMINPVRPGGGTRDYFSINTFGSLADEASLRSSIVMVADVFLEGTYVFPLVADVRTLQRSTGSISLPLDTPVGLRWTLESEAELIHDLNPVPRNIFDSTIYSNFGRTVYLDEDEFGEQISDSGFGFSLAGDSINAVTFTEIIVIPEPASAMVFLAAAGLLARRPR